MYVASSIEHRLHQAAVIRNVPEHVGDNEESHVAAANVDLIEMGDTAVAGGHSDILELNVHVVLGWMAVSISFCDERSSSAL